MSKLNKANNTSIFFDEILASFRPFIGACTYHNKKPRIKPLKRVFHYRTSFFKRHLMTIAPM
ncbi:hypothetical protein MU1CBH_02550 [Megamonas funiformis]|nr:hypothetical protein MU1CBH_02550 [Megamonas funiformis]